ncbi:hypothetical protein M6D93_05005 [Jatrophihabitans telluris]|uniref:Phosphotyrosine protein phosphatase I domain-containing protein n=1 Tax=Jatrophihabitans telluris TaxID=2038343 RepID=A0ABY4R2V5_9ACTN|nr:hypothetical protein [Jatrophihabitans telluris]UQX89364.1 hypothetical protein M6D93_05005 [Jatrophihabitans telluris]
MILFVCTGNIHRSAAAEAIFRARMEAASGSARAPRVSSAGTRAMVGYPIAPETASVLAELHVSATGHVARQLTPAIAQSADLILTAETQHRDQIIAEHPRLLRRAFTLREFARLGRAVPVAALPADLAARVQAVAALRGRVDRGPDSDDIADPVDRPLSVVRDRILEVQEAVEVVVRLTAPAKESG